MVDCDFFLMNGATPIALDNADLWNGINAAVNFNENNVLLNRDRVFTGSIPNGTRVTGTGDQPLGGTIGNIRTGRSDNLNWMTDFRPPRQHHHHAVPGSHQSNACLDQR